MKQPKINRLHIIESTDWKRAVIALLEPQSPYRPWAFGFGEVRRGDLVAIVLNTDPRAVVTSLGRIGTDGRLDRDRFEWMSPGPGLVDLDSLTMVLDIDSDPRDAWSLVGDNARRLTNALARANRRRDQRMRFGHSLVAAARVLLHSGGTCTGCDSTIDLNTDGATETFRIRTVDAVGRSAAHVAVKDESWDPRIYDKRSITTRTWPLRLPADWPGVLCKGCCARMHDGGHTNLIDFRFSQRSRCPKCGAAKTQAVHAGMPISADIYHDQPPWIDWRGCCDDGDTWICAMCAHRW